MSKKHKRLKQQQKFPWLLLALGGVFVVLAVFLFARQGSDGGGTPSIAVDRQKIDYGDQHFGANLTFAIKVTNAGDGILRFKEQPYIEVLEGC
jgi:hypothetical protein